MNYKLADGITEEYFNVYFSNTTGEIKMNHWKGKEVLF